MVHDIHNIQNIQYMVLYAVEFPAFAIVTVCDVWFKIHQSISIAECVYQSIHFQYICPVVNCISYMTRYISKALPHAERKKVDLAWPLQHISCLRLSILYHVNAAAAWRSDIQVLIVVVLCANKNTTQHGCEIPHITPESAKVSRRKFWIFSMLENILLPLPSNIIADFVPVILASNRCPEFATGALEEGKIRLGMECLCHCQGHTLKGIIYLN